MAKLIAGESRRLYCNDCSTEFEIILEPKAKGDDKKVIEPKMLDICPFCGERNIEDQDEAGEEEEGEGEGG